MKLIPKNWGEFQHYKDRSPPWIKLHKKILDDRAFMSLPLASKALAPMLWLLASEDKEGVFDASVDELSFRLRITEKEVEQGLNPLLDNGFFLDASTMLAPRLQVAVPETEKRQRRVETERGTRLPADWKLTQEFYDAVKKIKPDWPDSHIKIVADSFKDFWISKPGQGGVKLDWLATWRNWCRNDKTPVMPNQTPQMRVIKPFGAE